MGARDTVRTAVLSGTVLTEEPPDTRMVPTDMLLVEATEMDTEPHTATATEMDTDTVVKVTNTREFTHSKYKSLDFLPKTNTCLHRNLIKTHVRLFDERRFLVVHSVR